MACRLRRTGTFPHFVGAKNENVGMRFVLGDRSEGVITDFDGRVRVCETIDLPNPPADRAVAVSIDPPLPGDPPLGEAFLVPRHHPQFHLTPGASISVHVIDFSGSTVYWADVALTEEDLPKSQEERFDQALARLRPALEANPPNSIAELRSTADSVGLGVWVENMQSEQQRGRLRADWVSRLQELPGWGWQTRSRLDLLRGFAEREGHTDVPFDHVEGGSNIGAWVDVIRRKPSIVSDADRETLEQIPSWHW